MESPPPPPPLNRRRRSSSSTGGFIPGPSLVLLATATTAASLFFRDSSTSGLADAAPAAAALALTRRPIRHGGRSSSASSSEGSGGHNSRGAASGMSSASASASTSRRSRRRRGGGGGGGRGGGGGGGGYAAHHQWNPRRYFSVESVLPPLDVTELSAYASSSALLNGTDLGGSSDDDDYGASVSAEELFAAPYVVPSAHQSSDLGCSVHVCGPLPVLYTNHPKSIERWLSDHLHSSSSSSSSSEPCVVGFDVESVPTAPWIQKKASYDGPALVQISTPHECLVAQLTRRRDDRRSTSCPALEPFLSDPTIVKAGAGVDDDMLELFRFNPRLRGAGRFDLGGVGVSPDRRGRVGLARLVRSVLGVEMRKSKKLAVSDWSRCPLDDGRIAYAARDAWAGAAVAHDLAERRPDVFGPRAIARMLSESNNGGERSIEDLDDRARRRREAKRKLGEIYEQFREYGDVDGRRTLREQMPDLIAREMERLQEVVDETAPDGLITFDAEEIGLIL